MYHNDESIGTLLGHSCRGGGATIKNSPVTFNLHIHIHSNKIILQEHLNDGTITSRLTECIATSRFLSKLLPRSESRLVGNGQRDEFTRDVAEICQRTIEQ